MDRPAVHTALWAAHGSGTPRLLISRRFQRGHLIPASILITQRGICLLWEYELGSALAVEPEFEPIHIPLQRNHALAGSRELVRAARDVDELHGLVLPPEQGVDVLQILFAPREQRDADEYSAMLGTLTERATSRGRSHSFGGHGHSSTSQNESDQRRALLLPQEFKELGSERQVIILENCKPILAEKIRYYRDAAFQARLCPAPPVERLNLNLHLARVQERWRYADEEMEPDAIFDVDSLAHDLSQLPERLNGTSEEIANGLLDALANGSPNHAELPANGGSIEPSADDDGVLMDSMRLASSGREECVDCVAPIAQVHP